MVKMSAVQSHVANLAVHTDIPMAKVESVSVFFLISSAITGECEDN